MAWTGVSSIGLSTPQSLVWSSDLRRWIVGGQDGSIIYYSFNGINWFASTNGATIFNVVYSVTYNPRASVFLAAGQPGQGALGYSFDGQVWTAVSGSNGIFGNYGNDLCFSWAANLTIATGSGQNTVAVSTTTYTSFVGVGNNVFGTGSSFIANMCAYGSNGLFLITGSTFSSAINAGVTAIIGSPAVTANQLVATRVAMPSGSGTLSSITFYLGSGNGNAILAVYSDSGQGYPGSLIAQTITNTYSTIGYVTVSPSAVNASLPSDAIWIAVSSSGSLGRQRATTGGSTVFYTLNFGSSLPLTWPTTGWTATTESYTQYITVLYTSQVAYTYDGATFGNLGSAPAYSSTAGVAYSPALGLWFLGASTPAGLSPIYYSGSGFDWNAATAPALGALSFGVYSTSALSPTSKQGVYALSGVMPITPSQNQLKFLIGGTSGTAGSGQGMAYTLDNTNVFTYSPQGTGTTLFNGPVRTLVYAPELGLWLTSVQTAAAVFQNSYSTNPFGSWTVINSGITTATAVTSFTWSSTQQIFLATVGAATNNCFFSRTGVQWTVSTCATVLTTTVFSAAYSKQQNLWVAVGQGSVNNIAYTSNLAGSWTGVGGLTMTSARTVTFSPSLPLWVIGGQLSTGSTSILVTINPSIQTPVAATSPPFGTTGAIVNRCYWGGQGTVNQLFVCVATPGSGSSGTIAWSANGNTWTGLGTSIFSTAGFGVFYDIGSALWMAAGQGTNQIARSSDGKSWTAIATAPFASAASVVYAPISISNSLTRNVTFKDTSKNEF